MKVLVTGASGFLGGYLVARLVAEGYSVRALVRRVSNTRHVTIPGVELVRGDVKEPEDCRRAVAGVDAVVHAAAAVRGGWPARPASASSSTSARSPSCACRGRAASSARTRRTRTGC